MSAKIKRQNLSQISETAANLGNQSASGLSIESIARNMIKIQPGYAAFWKKVHRSVRDGVPLSRSLHEIWPDEFVKAVKTGEESGKVSATFANIDRIVAVKQEINKELYGFFYPLGILFAGLLTFCFYMIAVIPSMAKMLKGDDSLVMNLALNMEIIYNNYGAYIGIGFISIVAWIVYLFGQDSFKKKVLDFLFSIPILRDPLYKLYMGMWAAYVSLMTESGLSVIETLQKTLDLLPERPREIIKLILRDIKDNNMTMTDAVTKFKEDDIRNEMPHYLSSSFQVADQTGTLSTELYRVSPIMISDGKKYLAKRIKLANGLAMGLSAMFIVTPLGVYYMKIIEVAGSMR